MNKIKLSWSVLSQWSAGRKDEALRMLAGISKGNMYTEEGNRIHDIISENKLLLHPLMKPTGRHEQVSLKDRHEDPNYAVVEVFEWLDMSFKMDFVDPVEHILIDFKSGRKKSTEHNKMQLFVYAYLCTLLPEPIQIDKAIMMKVGVDEYNAVHCEDISIYKINEEKLALAENYIESNASEIYNLLQNNGNAN